MQGWTGCCVALDSVKEGQAIPWRGNQVCPKAGAELVQDEFPLFCILPLLCDIMYSI